MKTRTKVVIYAAPVGGRRHFYEGNAPDHEDYGKIKIVKATLVDHLIGGDPCRGNCGAKSCPESRTEETLMELSAHDASHLGSTLFGALDQALTVRDGARMG